MTVPSSVKLMSSESFIGRNQHTSSTSPATTSAAPIDAMRLVSVQRITSPSVSTGHLPFSPSVVTNRLGLIYTIHGRTLQECTTKLQPPADWIATNKFSNQAMNFTPRHSEEGCDLRQRSIPKPNKILMNTYS